MASGVLTAPAPRKGKISRHWWGGGPPPHERWPGVSIDFHAQWSSLRSRWETHTGDYYWDGKKADRAADFFPMFLRHHIGDFSGEPFVLRDDQAHLIIRPAFGWRRASDGTRRFRKVFAFCPKGWGKALALETPIPTPAGWTTMGALVAGDRVFDEHGQPCSVIAAHDVQIGRPCYRVGFDDGSSIVADAEHLWRTEDTTPPLTLKTTRYIAVTQGVSKHSILSAKARFVIVSCETVPSVPVRCITVDSASHLYQAGRSSVPTHNSPLGAGIGIYLARFDGEAAAEVYAVAADREQARTVHDNAKIMIENSPELYEGCEILRNSITWPDLYSKYVVLSSDASTKHGFRPHGVIFDEMHAQRNRDLFEALRKSMAKRLQPLMVIITHAGTDDEGIAFEEYDLAKRVLTGNTNLEATLPVIFELRRDEKWDDPVAWTRVNPGHGITIQHQDVLEECREAQSEPRKRNDFLRYHGNRWTNQATAWILNEWWDACEGVLDDAELVTLECAAGLDLAQKWDLACFAVVFRKYLTTPATSLEVISEETTGTITKRTIALNYELFVRPFFWIPENTMLQHEKEDGVPYRDWADKGLVTPTEGDIIDYTKIYEDITTKIVPRYPKLKQGTIGYDPAFATDISTKLRDLAGLQILEVLQNYKMISEPSQIMEALIKGKRVHHDGHRVLRWNWENAAVKTDDAGRIRPVKPRNASKRVDGAVAMIMGDKALSMQQPPKEPLFQMIILGKGGTKT